MITLKNREVTDISIDGVDFRDAPDFADAYVEAAVWSYVKSVQVSIRM